MSAHSKSGKFNTSKLIRTSFVVLVSLNLVLVWMFGGIFAKFASNNTSSQQTRASKFGVCVVTDATGEYAYDDIVINKTSTSNADDKLYFTLIGTPEVDVQVKIKLVFYNYYLPINNPDMIVSSADSNHYYMPKNLTVPLYYNSNDTDNTGTEKGKSYTSTYDASAHTLTVSYDGTISSEKLRFTANTQLNKRMYIKFNATDAVVPSLTNKEVEVIVEIQQVD